VHNGALTLYHGTAAVHVDSIRREGLRPTPSGDPGYIFLTASREFGVGAARAAASLSHRRGLGRQAALGGLERGWVRACLASSEGRYAPSLRRAAASASRRAWRSSRWASALSLAAAVRCSGVRWRFSASALRSASPALPARTFTALLTGAMSTSAILMRATGSSWSSTTPLFALTTRCVCASASSSARRLVVSPSKSLGHATKRPPPVAPLAIRALACELAAHTPQRRVPPLGHLLHLPASLGTVAREGERESLAGGAAQLTLLPDLGRRGRPTRRPRAKRRGGRRPLVRQDSDFESVPHNTAAALAEALRLGAGNRRLIADPPGTLRNRLGPSIRRVEGVR